MSAPVAPAAPAEPAAPATPAPAAPAVPSTPASPPASATPAPATPAAAPPAKPAEPMSRDAARGRMAERHAVKPAETPPATPAPAAPEAAAPATPAPAAPAVNGAPDASGTPSSPAAAAEAPKAIQVPIPEGHPLREQGLTFLTAVNEVEARAIRSQLNNPIRRAEAEATRAELRKAKEEIARRDAHEAARQKWQGTPEYKAKLEAYQRILESEGQPAADVYWIGATADLEKLTTTELNSRMGEIDAADDARVEREFVNEAWGQAQKLPESVRTLPGFKGWFDSAYQAFTNLLKSGSYPELLTIADDGQRADAVHARFREVFKLALGSRPEVKDALSRQQAAAASTQQSAADEAAAKAAEVERLKKQGVEEYLAAEAAKRRAVPPSPIAGVPAAPRSDAAPANSGDEPLPANATAHDARRMSRQAAGARAAQRVGGA